MDHLNRRYWTEMDYWSCVYKELQLKSTYFLAFYRALDFDVSIPL